MGGETLRYWGVCTNAVVMVLGLLLPGAEARAACRMWTGWHCDFTVGSALPVTKEMQELRLRPGTDELDLSGIEKTIELAQSRPEFDYTECLSRITGSEVRETSAPDTSESCAPEFTRIGEAWTRAKDRVYGHIARYGRGAYARGALPHFEPMGDLDPPLDSPLWHYPKRQQVVRPFAECGRGYIDRAVFTREIMNQLPSLTQGLSDDCRRNIGERLAELLNGLQLDARQCERHSEPCARRRAQLSQVIARLSAVGLTPYLNESHQALLRASCEVDWPDLHQSLRHLANEASSVASCRDLGPGETQLLNGDTGTGTRGQYALTRTGTASYRATVNLSFLNPGPQRQPLAEAADRQMRQQVQGCFERLRGALRGPGGETLELALHDPGSSSTQVPPLHSIVVDNGVSRMDASTWVSTIPCETMAHEIMHILGLPDEYPEASIGYQVSDDGSVRQVTSGATAGATSYDCRAIAPQDSLMHSHWEAFRRFWPTELRRCVCQRGDEACRVQAAELKPEAARCPDGSAPVASPVPTGRGDFWRKISNRVDYPPEQPKYGGQTWFYLNVPRPSLLYPAEFRAIVRPGCEAMNRTYYQCARYSTKTSPAHFGTDRCGVDRPAVCGRGGEEWLR